MNQNHLPAPRWWRATPPFRLLLGGCVALLLGALSPTPSRAQSQSNACETTLVFGTGTGTSGGKLRPGSVDPSFHGVSANFPSSPNAVVVTNPPAAWLANSSSAASQWLGPSISTSDDLAGTYWYQLRFTTPCARASVTGRYLAGDSGSLFLNGVNTHFDTPSVGYTNWTTFTLNNLPAGVNTLDFYVTNAPSFLGPPGATGLRAELTVRAICCACLELDCPPDIYVTTCSTTAPVNFTLTGTNHCSTNLVINCFLAAGTGIPITTNTSFPPGTNHVVCTAADGAGHSTNCSFNVVVVRDTMPPEIQCPGDIVYLCSPTATNVFYSVPVVDDTDPAPTVSCVPKSGSVFPIGTTPVTCSARDQCGNQSRCTFSVVISPSSFTKTLQGGVADNFQPGAVEPATASACLSTSGYWSGMPFDTSWPGRYFSHSFLGLPGGISSAKLIVTMRPTQTASQDDFLRIGLGGCGGPAVWSFAKPVGSLPGAGGSWVANGSTTFTLDLGALPGGIDLIPKLNADHRLDFAVGTETMVDYARLVVTYCGPLTTYAGVPYTITGAQPFHRGTSIDWRVVNSNTPVTLDFSLGLAEGLLFDFDIFAICPGIGANEGLSTVWPTGEGTTATLSIDASPAAGQTRISMSQTSNISGKAVEIWKNGQLVTRYFLSGSGDTGVDLPSSACLQQMGFAGDGYFFANFNSAVPMHVLAGEFITGQVGPTVSGDSLRLFYDTTVAAPGSQNPLITLKAGVLSVANLAIEHDGTWTYGSPAQQLTVSDVVISQALYEGLKPYSDCSPAYGPWSLALNGVSDFCTLNGTNPPQCQSGSVEINITGPGNGNNVLNFGGVRLTPTSLPDDACHVDYSAAGGSGYAITVHRLVGGPLTLNNLQSVDLSHWPTHVDGSSGPQFFQVYLPNGTTVSVGGQTYDASDVVFTCSSSFLGDFYQVCLSTALLQKMSFQSLHSIQTSTPPPCVTLTCPSNVVANCAGEAGTVVTFNPTAVSRCGSNVVITCIPPSGSAFPPGVSVVYCDATDSQGYHDRCHFTVTVQDTTPPRLLTPARVMVPCQGPNGASVDFASGAVDNCDPHVVVVCRPPSGSVFPVGTNYVVCNAIDAGGNRSSVEFPVIVNGGCGTTNCISLTVPLDLTTNCNAGGAIVTYVATAKDICTGAQLTPTCVPPSGSAFPIGLTRVICSVTSGVATATSSFMVEVVDQTPPQIDCPTNRTVLAQSPLGAVVSYTVTGHDDCSPQVRIRCAPASGTAFAVGTTRVYCEAFDSSGNRTQCVFTVTVTPPPPLTLTLAAGDVLVLHWIGEAVVEAADEMGPNAVWTPLALVPEANGAERSLRLPRTASNRFFRIQPTPLLPPVDTDGDGVPDSVDLCPNTPVGLPAVQDGCSYFDIITSPEAAFSLSRGSVDSALIGLLRLGGFPGVVERLSVPTSPANNTPRFIRQRQLPAALTAQLNSVTALRGALADFLTQKMRRLDELARLATPLDAAHADVRPEDFEVLQLEQIETALTDGLSRGTRMLTLLSNIVQSTGTVVRRQRVMVQSFDNARGVATLTDGRVLILPTPNDPGAPALGSITDAISPEALMDTDISTLPDGSLYGVNANAVSAVSSSSILQIDPRCLELRVVPTDFGLPNYESGTRHRLRAYKWGFTEALSHHYLEFGMALAPVKISCAAETPGAYKHWLQIKADVHGDGFYTTVANHLDENSTPYILTAAFLPTFQAFNILIREYRVPTLRATDPPGTATPELVSEETQLIEINKPGDYAEAFYDRTAFDIEDDPNTTQHDVGYVTDIGLGFPLILKPLNEMKFSALSFQPAGNGSSYPDVRTIGLNDPFAVHFDDPNNRVFFANPADAGRGLAWPTLEGNNHGRPFVYRVRLPQIVRDRLHDCGGGNTFDSPDTYYRIPFYTLWQVSQGNNGTFTHKGWQRYAFDFPAPYDTPVIAARGGLVVDFRESSAFSCWNPVYQNPDGTTGSCQGCTGVASPNYITIQHQDGTFGVYMHFRMNGVLVQKGDRVYRGTPIGKVGTTGCSTGFHLHFQAMDPAQTTTIPVSFEALTFDFQLHNCYVPPSNSIGFSTNHTP